MRSLECFDIVYSWGVLHHTGDLFKALNNIQIPVKKGGVLFIAIYNDQGFISKFWKKVKQFYCSSLSGRILTSALFYPFFFLISLAAGMVRFKNPIRYFSDYKKRRGMSLLNDWKDWLGGYPFEVAKPEDIFSFFHKRGFQLQKMTTTNRNGNNQFVFKKMDGRIEKI
jgi:2-polyprenyl-6-hydroxyphenyl methylase/3-demethylubiquinone-9 3-methyltransferase